MDKYDFLIVGAGIAGAAVAYRLAAHGSVVIVEMEQQPGYHASGRSTATFVESYGGAVAGALTSASRTFLTAPPDGFSAVPLLSKRGNLRIGSEAERPVLEAEYAACAPRIPDLRMIDTDSALALCPALRPEHAACALFEPDACDMDVHAIHQGYLKGAREHGAVLLANSPIERIARHQSGWQVRAGAHLLTAGTVVNAAGAWADEIARMAGVKTIGLQPRRRTVVTFDPPNTMRCADWPLVRDATESFYFKPFGSGVLATPADAAPSAPCDAQPEELEIAVAMQRLSQATTLAPSHLTSRWAGLRSFVSDEAPVIGVAPDCPEFFWVAGLGGFGIQTSAAVGQAAVALITGGAWLSGLVDAGVRPEQLSPARLLAPTR